MREVREQKSEVGMATPSRATRADVEAALAAAMDAQSSLQGWRWWPGPEMAAIAYRRWHSFTRRHKSHEPTKEMRVNDLLKGLQSHFEPDIPYTHANDWRALAEVLASVLKNFDDQGGNE